ncbi:MAG TPA: condensation domain-containing protein [Thermoanaerobaculia bacterium]|nr:condensation domain-containing protein [Thermoanaerobaculia bacterium]
MQVADIEDIVALSLLQQEMLFHAVQHPKDDVHVVQLCVSLSGPLSLPALEAAWDRMAARHPALRTSFRPWKVPAQLVQRRVKLPFAVHERRQDPEIASFLEEDRARGFDPAAGPLIRLSVLRTAPDEHLLVWTHHRLALDSWSATLLVRQVLAAYREGADPEGSPSPRKYRDYVDWQRQQDATEAERFWRRELAGLSAPPPLGSPEPLAGRTGWEEVTVRLAAPVTAALLALSAERELSLETLALGAWALVLSRRTGQGQVLFGITAPGRPAALPEAESIVGRFANTLPLRVTVAPKAPLLPWLRGLKDRRDAVRPYEHVPLSRIAEWSGLPPGTPLLQSRLAVESFPVSIEPGSNGTGIGIREIQWIEASAEPLTVFVRPGAELVIAMAYQRAFFEESEILGLQEELRGLLEIFAADPRKRLSEIVAAAADLQPGQETRRLDKIAQIVQRRTIATHEPEAPPKAKKELGGHEIVRVSRDQPLLATFYQEWALQLDGVTRNSIPLSLRIAGAVDLTALRRTLMEIARRHESLRTSFRLEGGEAYLVLAPPAEVPLPTIDLSALPVERKAERMRRLMSEHACKEFDMARGPLFIARLLRLGSQENVLLLNTHHLISDGWSIQVLQRELMVLYAAFAQGRPSPLDPLPIQLADFAYWQRRVFAGEALAAQLAWWRDALANLPPPPGLPIDKPRPESLGLRVLEAAAVLPPGPTKSLKELSQTTRSSLPMVLLAAVNALLHAYNGQEDLILSLIFAARNRPELSNQIGLFMNTVPLRVNLSGNPSFRQLTERVRDSTIDAYAHQDVPFPRLLAELFPGRKLTRTILSGVCFNMLSFNDPGATAGPPPPGGLTVQILGGEDAEAKHDLVVSSSELGGSLRFELGGAADLFTPERLAMMTRDFEALLTYVANDPEVSLARLRQSVQNREWEALLV